MRDAAGWLWKDVQFALRVSPTLRAGWMPVISGSADGGANKRKKLDYLALIHTTDRISSPITIMSPL
jgi:hypothetical protein